MQWTCDNCATLELSELTSWAMDFRDHRNAGFRFQNHELTGVEWRALIHVDQVYNTRDRRERLAMNTQGALT
jgi:hypothetical protein